MLCESVHGLPADLRVDEDQLSDPGENLTHAGLQLNTTQGVHAQVEEVQVGNVRNNGADLATKL